MGQSVNQQLGTDPDYIRSQILKQREQGFQQITNPFQQASARLGSILGGGIANIANDRGFFEVSDPLLTKVTQIQGIYNQVAGQIDPSANPTEFYSALQKAYADAGLGQQALLAAQEAKKSEREGLTLESARLDLFTKNPELLDKEIIKAENSGDEEKVAQLAGLKKRVEDARDLERRKTEAQIEQAKSTAAVQRATADGKDIVYVPDITGAKIPYERKGNTLVPLKIEGQEQPGTPAGQGQGKFSQGKRGVYNPQTGKVEYK